jgi:peptide/nickel transport system ATP-binding protein
VGDERLREEQKAAMRAVVTAADQEALAVDDLRVDYVRRDATVNAVRGLSFSLWAGEVLAVVGESGSGKTTVANAIIGLLPDNARVRSGSVRLAGREVVGASERALLRFRRELVALIPQDPTMSLSPTKTVGAHLRDTLRLRGIDRRQIPVLTHDALSSAGLDAPALRARQYPHQLSGGMRQRVLIALALAADPALIIADEPTSALDVTVQRAILDHLESLVRERGIGLVIITHDLGVAADRADQILVMKNGEIVDRGSPGAVLHAARTPYTRRLIAAAPSLAHQGRLVPRHPDLEPAPALVEFRSVSVDFPLPRTVDGPRRLRALDAVSFEAGRGQTLAVVGESGSGKSTALRVALGLVQATDGGVSFDGEDIGSQSWTRIRVLRRRFQLVQQSPYAALNPRLSIFDSLVEPLRSYRLGTRASRLASARELLGQVALPRSVLDRMPDELSGGQRQRVAIARALILQPELLYLDEPASALDVSIQKQILDLLVELQDRLGLTYVFVSHDLGVVAQIAHRVVVLRGGKVVEQGSVQQVFTDPNAEYTAELIESIPGGRRAKEIIG